MDPSLVQLMEELVASIEQREAASAETSAGAAARIRRLEREIARRLEEQRSAAALSRFRSERGRSTKAHLEPGVAGSVA
jgi:hypothetical protein